MSKAKKLCQENPLCSKKLSEKGFVASHNFFATKAPGFKKKQNALAKKRLPC
jgi:hypothetical protein